MPSPTFNGNPIFSALDVNGNPFQSGDLIVKGTRQITQSIHFDQEVGSYTLFHGDDNIPWEYNGYLSAWTSTTFWGLVTTIKTVILANSSGNYYTLVDSWGISYPNCQVRTFDIVSGPHVGGMYTNVAVSGVAGTSGMFAVIKCTGVYVGNAFGGV